MPLENWTILSWWHDDLGRRATAPRNRRLDHRSCGVRAIAVRDIGLRDATDQDIFASAHTENVIVITKDRDFVDMVDRHGIPPSVIWLTCGNTSNARLREILSATLFDALALVQAGEPVVEISGQ